MKKSLALIFAFILFFLSGCSYKPASYYTKNEIGKRVFVNMDLNIEDPRNNVIIKDTVIEILAHRLGSKVVENPKYADTILDVKLNSVSMSLLQDDNEGYGKLYKATVNINLDYNKGSEKKHIVVTGDYDFSIDSGSEIDDTQRYRAIRNAASKALDEMVSKMAVNSLKK